MFFDSIKINDNNETNYLKNFYAGNLFLDEYVPYKNYPIFKIKATTPKEILDLNIMLERFIINDLNLYLDINPNNEELFRIFEEHKGKLKKYIDEYEKKYNALTITGNMNKYDWSTNFNLEGTDV